MRTPKSFWTKERCAEREKQTNESVLRALLEAAIGQEHTKR